MLEIVYTNKMKRDVRLMQKRGKDISKLVVALSLLANRKKMPVQYRDHALKGEWAAFRECHIEGDWLLIYQICEAQLILFASGTGSHSDLFDK